MSKRKHPCRNTQVAKDRKFFAHLQNELDERDRTLKKLGIRLEEIENQQ